MTAKQKQRNKKDIQESVALNWTSEAWEDYMHWVENDPDILQKVNELISEIRRTPFTGTGKPEPLRGNLTGFWSRRITREHRIVYMMHKDTLFIAACRYHYDE